MKGASLAAAAVFLLATVPALSDVCGAPAGWMALKAEDSSPFQAALNFGSETPQVGAPFDVEFRVCSSGKLAVDRLTVDATMPAHKHGMNYAPQLSKASAQAYKATGFLFHMPGVWRLTLSIYSSGTPSHLSAEITIP